MAYSTFAAPAAAAIWKRPTRRCDRFVALIASCADVGGSFAAAFARMTIGSLQLAEIGLSPCRVIRDHRDEHYRGDQFFLIFQAEGSTRMRQRGSEVTLRPGDSTLIDSRFPSVFESQEGFLQYSFHLPVALINERFGRRQLPLAQPIHGDRGAGRLLSDLLSSLVRNASSLAGVELTGLTLQWLSTALGINDCGESVRDLERRAICAQAVAHYINSHIEEQDLTPQGIAAHFNISLRQLYRVMSSAGSTPAAMIWKHRLERARALLARQRPSRADHRDCPELWVQGWSALLARVS